MSQNVAPAVLGASSEAPSRRAQMSESVEIEIRPSSLTSGGAGSGIAAGSVQLLGTPDVVRLALSNDGYG